MLLAKRRSLREGGFLQLSSLKTTALRHQLSLALIILAAFTLCIGDAEAAGITYGPLAAHQDPPGGGPPTSVRIISANASTPGSTDEHSRDQTFSAPQVTFSGIATALDTASGTTCKITWTTNLATSTNIVHWRASGSGPYSQAAIPSHEARTDHSVTLSGLAPDTQYDFHVSSGAEDTAAATSFPDATFRTPAELGTHSVQIGLVMVGGGIKDDWDDVGPSKQVQRMIEADILSVNASQLSGYHWPHVQPKDPGSGPNTYDWSKGDAGNANRIVGKARTYYFDVYGTCPSWLTFDSDRYWQKFAEFVEAMTVHMNQMYGDVDYIFDNEPNIYRGPSGWNWADWYMHCLKHFYAAVHRADAKTGKVNRVIGANLCGHSADGFKDLYARGFKNYSDLVGYHAYANDLRDGLEVADLATIHSIQVANGDADKKVFVGEGWGSDRSAGFGRSSPTIEPSAGEIENLWLALVKGWDNVMTPRANWDPSYLCGMRLFTGNDNWGMKNWRKRATPQKDSSGNITGFVVDGYPMTPDIAPAFWNGGMVDFYGNSKDCLIHVFPGNGLALMNPGFEVVSSPPNVHLAHFWSTAATPAPIENYAIDEAVFHGGSHSLKLRQTSGGSSGVYQMTTKRSVLPGVQYRARVWCKTQDSSGLSTRFYLRFTSIDGSLKSSQYWATGLTGTAGWRQMEALATSPSYATSMEVGCYIRGVGTAWFDDVTIAMASQSQMAAIRGYTVDEGQNPLAKCIVRTTTGAYQAVSDANGYYEIANVAAGTYDLVCRKAGHVPHRVRNQTVAPGKITFASFNLGIPKPGLVVTKVTCDKPTVTLSEGPAIITVFVSNSKPYPVNLSDVGVFVERGVQDATENFVILPSQSNPKTIAASGSAQFSFTLAPRSAAEGAAFSINAYVSGQEDRPNLLQNGNFDSDDSFSQWEFWTAVQTNRHKIDKEAFSSSPNALKWYVDDPSGDKFSWVANLSAHGKSAPTAYPRKNYIVGANHKDTTNGQVDILLYIEEYYYDGTKWLYNGRRFSAVPHRSTWTSDRMVYETGDPSVTPGLYSTNRLKISVGSWIRAANASSINWWDDVYLKEEGDWLADDRADMGAALAVAK